MQLRSLRQRSWLRLRGGLLDCAGFFKLPLMEKVISDLVQRIPEEPLQITLFTITQQVTCRETLYVLVEKILEDVQSRPEHIPVSASLIQLLRVSSDWRDNRSAQLGWRFFKLLKEECMLRQEANINVQQLLNQIEL